VLRLILGYLQDRRLRRTHHAGHIPELWAWLAARRVRLGGLSRPVQVLAGSCLVTAGLAGGLLVAQGAGLALPGGRDPNPLDAPLPALVPAAAYGGWAVIAASLALAAQQPGWRWPRLTLTMVGLAGATFAAYMVAIALLTIRAPRSADLLGIASTSIWVGLVAGVLGLAAAALLVGAAPRLLRGPPTVLCLVAALPFALALLIWVLADTQRVAVPPDALARLGLTSGISARALFAVPAVKLSAALGLSVGLLLLWQVVGGSRAARDAGLLASALGGDGARLLIALLAAKLLWLGLAYAGLLPAILGSRAEDWTDSRQDGWLSWALAAGLVGTALWWLATRDRREPLSEVGFTTAVWVVVAGFQLFPLLASLVLASEPWELLLSTLTPVDGAAEVRTSLGNVLGALFIVSVPLTVIGAAVAVPILLRPKRTARNPARLSAAIFLAAFAAWNLPRIVIGSGQMLGVWPQTTPLPGSVEPASVDALLTIGIAVLLALWWRGRQRGAGPAALMLVLLASTLVTHATTLWPPEWRQGAFYFIGLVLPLAYALLFDAAALNEATHSRPARVLATVGVTAILLVLASVQVAVGLLRPDRATEAELGVRLLLVPFAAILVATTIDNLSQRQPRVQDPMYSNAPMRQP
jgi:hypothetical protein